jgi:hypothetical protein
VRKPKEPAVPKPVQLSSVRGKQSAAPVPDFEPPQDYMQMLPGVLRDAHRRTGSFGASIDGSGVVHFTAARTRTPGWVVLVNVENQANKAMSIELLVTRLLYVFEQSDPIGI